MKYLIILLLLLVGCSKDYPTFPITEGDTQKTITVKAPNIIGCKYYSVNITTWEHKPIFTIDIDKSLDSNKITMYASYHGTTANYKIEEWIHYPYTQDEYIFGEWKADIQK